MKYGLMCPNCRNINNFPQKMPQVPPGKFTWLTGFICAGCRFKIRLPTFIVLHEINPISVGRGEEVSPARYDALVTDLLGHQPPSHPNVPEPTAKAVVLNNLELTVDDLLLSDIMPKKPEYDYCTGDDKCACPNCYEKNGYGE